MKTVTIDFQDENSIKQAERQKARLENQGYSLYHTLTDSRFSTLIYQRNKLNPNLQAFIETL